jgi:hypothetical protein
MRLRELPRRKITKPRGARSGQALEAQNAEYSMNDIDCESAIAAFLHLVLSREKPTHTFNDVQIMSRIPHDLCSLENDQNNTHYRQRGSSHRRCRAWIR